MAHIHPLSEGKTWKIKIIYILKRRRTFEEIYTHLTLSFLFSVARFCNFYERGVILKKKKKTKEDIFCSLYTQKIVLRIRAIFYDDITVPESSEIFFEGTNKLLSWLWDS